MHLKCPSAEVVRPDIVLSGDVNSQREDTFQAPLPELNRQAQEWKIVGAALFVDRIYGCCIVRHYLDHSARNE